MANQKPEDIVVQSLCDMIVNHQGLVELCHKRANLILTSYGLDPNDNVDQAEDSIYWPIFQAEQVRLVNESIILVNARKGID